MLKAKKKKNAVALSDGNHAPCPKGCDNRRDISICTLTRPF